MEGVLPSLSRARGRKPNPLVLEFFIRGEKTAGSSNRYEHTCKACAEHFKKGRLETLIAHITETCPHLSVEQRDHIVQRNEARSGLIDSQTVSSNASSPETHQDTPQSASLKGFEQADLQPDGSSSIEQTPSLSNPHQGVSDAAFDDKLLEEALVTEFETEIPDEDATSLADLFQYPDEDFEKTLLEEALAEEFETTMPDGNTAATGNLFHNTSNVDPDEALLEEELAAEFDAADWDEESPQVPSNTAMSPCSSNTLLLCNTANGNRQGGIRTVERQEYSFQVSTSPPSQEAPHSSTQLASNDLLLSSQKRSPGPIRSGKANFSPREQKIRGKLSNTRRREVHTVRSKGACVRCRMLRKTCSGGDPCTACCKVNSAKKWTIPCLRVKLASAIEMYTADPFGKLSEIRIQLLLSQSRTGEAQIPLKFRFKGDPFNSIIVTSSLATPRPEHTPLDWGHNLPQYFLPPNQIWMAVGDQVDDLLYRSTLRIHDYEPYQMVQSCLKEADRWKLDKKDKFVAQALHLWDLTHLITAEGEDWVVSDVADSSEARPSIPSHALGSGNLPHDHTALLKSQISALAARYASKAFTTLITTLESMLLRPSMVYRFSHFISILLLFASLERLTAWTHKFLEGERRSHETNGVHVEWPLSLSTSYFRTQIESFVDLVITLANARRLPPKMTLDSTGAVTMSDGSRGEIDYQETLVWLSNLGMTKQFLEERRDAVYDPGDFRSLEMKYCARAILQWLPDDSAW